MNASRHWLRARLERRDVSITLNLRPGMQFDDVDAEWQQLASVNPRAAVQSTLASMVPASAAAATLQHLGLERVARRCGGTIAPAVAARSKAAAFALRRYNFAEATGRRRLPKPISQR